MDYGERPPPPDRVGTDVGAVSEAALDVETYRILDPDGAHDPDRVPDLSERALRDLYRWMVLQRRFEQRCVTLQRRGALGTYPSGRGQEAATVGMGFALAEGDWLFPYGREAGALLLHGMSMRDLLLYWRGVADAARQEANIVPPSISIGSHLPMVAGAGWGMALDEAGTVAVANLGDGATSTGAFHEGINFAGVLGAPAVFFCQNNQYAISLPFEEQTAADTVAQKAVGYGIEGVRVDGNDALAVYAAVSEARRRALDGTPVLVEAVTYRQGPHTTSDDPGRYREEAEVGEWERRDPIDRYRRFLEEAGLWDGIDEETLREDIEEDIDAAVAAADDYPERDVEEVFAHVHGELTPELRRQLEEYRAFLEDHPDAYGEIEHRPKG